MSVSSEALWPDFRSILHTDNEQNEEAVPKSRSTRCCGSIGVDLHWQAVIGESALFALSGLISEFINEPSFLIMFDVYYYDPSSLQKLLNVNMSDQPCTLVILNIIA